MCIRDSVYSHKKEYNLAAENYTKGIEVSPNFPSNYFNLANLYFSSTNKLAGIIYGEIFMNLERTTQRTIEMSESLFNAYDQSIYLSKDSSSIDFCEIRIDATSLTDGEIKLPLCATFGKNFILSIIGEEEVSLKSLSQMRTNFLKLYFEKDFEEYPNVLFDYHKSMEEAGVFEAYNYYLFQMAKKEDFAKWHTENEEAFNKFVNWFTSEENILTIDQDLSLIHI